MAVEAMPVYLVYLASMVGAAAGLYGVMSARSLVKLFASIEVFFNSIIFSAAYIGYLIGADPGFYSLLLATIVLTIAEIAIVAAILVLAYRRKKSLDVDMLREVRG